MGYFLNDLIWETPQSLSTSFESFNCRIETPQSPKHMGLCSYLTPQHTMMFWGACAIVLVPAFVRLCIPQKVQTGKYQKMKRRFKTEQSDAFSAGTLHFGDICLSVHLFILFLQEMLNFVASNSWGQIILNIAEPPKNWKFYIELHPLQHIWSGRVVQLEGEKTFSCFTRQQWCDWVCCSEIDPPPTDKWAGTRRDKNCAKKLWPGGERFHTNERSVSGKLQGGTIAMRSFEQLRRNPLNDCTEILCMIAQK